MILVVCSTVIELNTDIMNMCVSAEKTRIDFQPEFALLPEKEDNLIRSNNSEMKQYFNETKSVAKKKVK
jgi:hypothetical protein